MKDVIEFINVHLVPISNFDEESDVHSMYSISRRRELIKGRTKIFGIWLVTVLELGVELALTIWERCSSSVKLLTLVWRITRLTVYVPLFIF